jgi:type III secretion system PrgH/EprH family protein
MVESMDMAEKIDQMKPSGYVFKVLSGSMNGIEFSLGSHAYFMCTSAAAEGQENLARSLEHAERTLYLPTTGAGHNFVVNLADQVTEEEFVVTVSYPDRQDTLTFAFNTICQVEGTYFALKREGEAWSEDVIKGVLPTATTTETEKVSNQTVAKSSGWKYQWVIATILIILLAGAGGTMAWFKYGAAPGPDSATTMLKQLGNNAGYSVQLGRDKTYYLFAQNNQLADWARRSMTRVHSTDAWKIVTPQEEETRLVRILDREHIAYFTIRLNDLHAPTLVLSSTRNATDPVTLKQIKKVLLDGTPYAEKINIELKSDQDVLRLAEEGLVALGFDYQMTQSDSGVTLSTSMSSGDSRMAELNRFVAQFYRLWGRHYVHFSVELRDDALKEKSFKYGQDGYVNMGKSHWLFNN